MIDPYARHAARMRMQRRRALASQLRQVLFRRVKEARAAPSPFKLGDYLAGDDPFNGCREGVVAVINGSSIGLRTTVQQPGTTPSGKSLVYYDYRQLRRPW